MTTKTEPPAEPKAPDFSPPESGPDGERRLREAQERVNHESEQHVADTHRFLAELLAMPSGAAGLGELSTLIGGEEPFRLPDPPDLEPGQTVDEWLLVYGDTEAGKTYQREVQELIRTRQKEAQEQRMEAIGALAGSMEQLGLSLRARQHYELAHLAIQRSLLTQVGTAVHLLGALLGLMKAVSGAPEVTPGGIIH
jgi:hypothetical protein